MRHGADLPKWRAAEYWEYRSKRHWQKRAKSPASEKVVLHPQADAEFFLAQQRYNTHVGLRYSDIANQQVLPAYYTLDAGLAAQIGRRFEVRLQGSNLTDQLGLTEGNARVVLGSGSGISNGLEMARPIFGREAQLQLRYQF
jgi:outer membrane receptor protein involved in Fe transport